MLTDFGTRRRRSLLGGPGRLPPRLACVVGLWIGVVLTASFWWAASRPAADDAAQLSTLLATKPAYCRSDLPGCVPKDIAYVFVLAAPESGQDLVHAFIESQTKPGSGGMQLAACDLAGAMGDSSFCFSASGDHHAPDTRDKSCEAQRVALGLLHQQPFFERLRCNYATGQYDFSLLYSLPKETLERTLVVLTVRDPIQQTAALHRVFSQLDPARLCPGRLQEGGAALDTSKCTKLSDFARRGFAGTHPVDSLVKTLAGDYCCYQAESFAEDEARMQAAVMNFLRVGVVLDADNMQSGLQYLAHVLGWEQGAVLPVARPAREAVDSDEQRKLRSMLARDYAVYRLVQQHALEQQDFTASLA